MITAVFVIGIWLFIVGVSNLDIIHKSSWIGEDLAEELKCPAPESWQDYLLREVMYVGIILVGFSVVYWIVF